MGKGKSVSSVYTSAGCNRYSNVADVRDDGLVVYGAGKLVCLWDSEVPFLLLLALLFHLLIRWISSWLNGVQDPQNGGIHQTLPGHRGTVTTIKFVPTTGTTSKRSDSFVSADTAGGVIVWHQDTQNQVCDRLIAKQHFKAEAFSAGKVDGSDYYRCERFSRLARYLATIRKRFPTRSWHLDRVPASL